MEFDNFNSYFTLYTYPFSYNKKILKNKIFIVKKYHLFAKKGVYKSEINNILITKLTVRIEKESYGPYF